MNGREEQTIHGKRFVLPPQRGHHRKETAHINVTPFLQSGMNTITLRPEYFVGREKQEDGPPPFRFLCGIYLVKMRSTDELFVDTARTLQDNGQKRTSEIRSEIIRPSLRNSNAQNNSSIPSFYAKNNFLPPHLLTRVHKILLYEWIQRERRRLRLLLGTNTKTTDTKTNTNKYSNGTAINPSSSSSSPNSSSQDEDSNDEAEIVGENVDSSAITLTCPISAVPFEVPVVSKWCGPHLQAFDLRSFVQAQETTRNVAKRWKCPLCSARAMTFDLKFCDFTAAVLQQAKSYVAEVNLRNGVGGGGGEVGVLGGGGVGGGGVVGTANNGANTSTGGASTSGNGASNTNFGDDDDFFGGSDDDNVLTIEELEKVVVQEDGSYSFTYEEERKKEQDAKLGAAIDLDDEDGVGVCGGRCQTQSVGTAGATGKGKTAGRSSTSSDDVKMETSVNNKGPKEQLVVGTSTSKKSLHTSLHTSLPSSSSSSSSTGLKNTLQTSSGLNRNTNSGLNRKDAVDGYYNNPSALVDHAPPEAKRRRIEEGSNNNNNVNRELLPGSSSTVVHQPRAADPSAQQPPRMRKESAPVRHPRPNTEVEVITLSDSED